MKNRHLLMLAVDYDPLKYKINSSFMSEKLDGVRALWLPFTRGMNFKDVFFANTARDTRNPICSGLWTRRGKNIAAPNWFLDALPDMPLDGELFKGRGMFQATTGVVRKLEPLDTDWADIRYSVFDIPSYFEFFRHGRISEGLRAVEPAYSAYFPITMYENFKFLQKSPWWNPKRFTDVLYHMTKLGGGDIIRLVEQKQLPASDAAATRLVETSLAEVLANGGEGLMLRRGHSMWTPYRFQDLAKIKPEKDSEAMVVGYYLGEAGKYEGMIGAIRVRWNGKLFEIGSGFTNPEREMVEGILPEPIPDGVYTELPVSKQFPIGSMITFKYTELTDDGIPRFPRYHRKFEG